MEDEEIDYEELLADMNEDELCEACDEEDVSCGVSVGEMRAALLAHFTRPKAYSSAHVRPRTHTARQQSINEWLCSLSDPDATFHALDANGDGEVTLAELQESGVMSAEMCALDLASFFRSRLIVLSVRARSRACVRSLIESWLPCATLHD